MAPLQKECILFHPETKRFFMLNATASFVWAQLETASDVESLASGLCDAFEGVDADLARRDVHDAIANLVELTLVEPLSATREDEVGV